MLAAILTTGQLIAVAISAVALASLLVKFVVLPMRRMYRMVMSIGVNGQKTIFQTLHEMRDDARMSASLSDVIDLPIFRCDKDGNVTHVNVAFRRLTGLSADDVGRGGFRDRIGSAFVQEDWDDHMEAGRLFERPCFFTSANGREMRVTILAAPVHVDDRLIGWRGTVDRLGDGQDDQ